MVQLEPLTIRDLLDSLDPVELLDTLALQELQFMLVQLQA